MFRRPFRSLHKASSVARVEAVALAPLSQARRCLEIWLREEGRFMPPRQRQRSAALIARYFAHEDDVSDALILSFLRHYSGFSAVDLDDPQSVRLELKASLDQAVLRTVSIYGRPWLAATAGIITTAAMLIFVYLSQQTLSPAQQDELRAAVAGRARTQGVAVASVWAGIKRDFGVTRYQDIRRWDYAEAMGRLQ